VGGRLRKFAGLGAWGRATRRRAEALAEAGLGPTVHGLVDGHLEVDWIDGTPLTAACPALIAAAAAQVRHTSARSPGPFDADATIAWILENVREGLGVALDPDRLAAHVPDAPAVDVDGRMLLHEWLRTPGGRLLKVDAVDHCDDHFVPGRQQAAWDVAALAAEVDPGLADAVADLCGVRPTPFHHVGWRAWRLGQATLAEATTEAEERARWSRVRGTAERRLAEAVAWLG
jgi:hypothetical protein